MLKMDSLHWIIRRFRHYDRSDDVQQETRSPEDDRRCKCQPNQRGVYVKILRHAATNTEQNAVSYTHLDVYKRQLYHSASSVQ